MTNPSIPEAAIDAGAEALHQADERGAPEAYHEWAHRVVEAVLRAAAPHLVGGLVEVARICAKYHECEGCGEGVPDHVCARVVLAILEESYSEDAPSPGGEG